MEKTKSREDVLIQEFKKLLVHAGHDHWRKQQFLKSSPYHAPEFCIKRTKRQDPPFCPMCHSWMRDWNDIDFKTVEEIWDYYSTIFNVAVNEYAKILEG